MRVILRWDRPCAGRSCIGNTNRPRTDYDADLAEIVAATKSDWIVLAGWMHVFSMAFLGKFPNRVINLHPALPGQFAGVDAIHRAYEAFQRGEISFVESLSNGVGVHGPIGSSS